MKSLPLKWRVEFLDEASGMSRKGYLEVQADSKQDALDKVKEKFKDAGPGIYPIDAELVL